MILVFWQFKTAFAQVDSIAKKPFKVTQRLFFAVSGGLAVPVGKFRVYERYGTNGDPNLGSGYNYAGVPKWGGIGKVEVMFLVFKNLGITCTYYAAANKADTLGQNTLYPNYPPTALGGGSSTSLTHYSATTWYTNNILFGIAPQLNLAKLKLRFKLSGGWQQVKTPETKIDGMGYSWNISQGGSSSAFSITQPSMISHNFVFGAGFDIRFTIKKNLGFIVSMDLLNSYAHFKGNLIDQNGNSTPNSFDKLISIYSFNAGLCYQIK